MDDVARSEVSESHEMIFFFFGDIVIIDGPESIAFHWIRLTNYTRHAHHHQFQKSSTMRAMRLFFPQRSKKNQFKKSINCYTNTPSNE